MNLFMYGCLERQLADRPWLLGDQFSLAEAAPYFQAMLGAG